MTQSIEPLNTIFSEFKIDEAEQRLETDPLTLGGLFDLKEPEIERSERCVVVGGCTCNGHDNACVGKTVCIIN